VNEMDVSKHDLESLEATRKSSGQIIKFIERPGGLYGLGRLTRFAM
jgi:hypothetical protein